MATTDPVRDQLFDAATVHAARSAVRPAVTDVVAELKADPLGGPETLTKLARLTTTLEGTRAAAGREARLRLHLSLAEERTRSA